MWRMNHIPIDVWRSIHILSYNVSVMSVTTFNGRVNQIFVWFPSTYIIRSDVIFCEPEVELWTLEVCREYIYYSNMCNICARSVYTKVYNTCIGSERFQVVLSFDIGLQNKITGVLWAMSLFCPTYRPKIISLF